MSVNEKSRTQRAIEYIFAHPGCRSDVLAEHLQVETKQITNIITPAVVAGLIVKCKVERPGKQSVTEFKPSAAAPMKAPDLSEWKRDKQAHITKPLKFSAKGPRDSGPTAIPVSGSHERTTPAAGGEHNSGSRASESLVEAATTSTEGAAVGPETQAGSHAPEGLADTPGEARPAVSDEMTSSTPLLASIGLRGALMIQAGNQKMYLTPSQTRELGFFLSDTEQVWN